MSTLNQAVYEGDKAREERDRAERMVESLKAELAVLRTERTELSVLYGYAFQEARNLMAKDAYEVFVTVMDTHRAALTSTESTHE